MGLQQYIIPYKIFPQRKVNIYCDLNAIRPLLLLSLIKIGRILYILNNNLIIINLKIVNRYLYICPHSWVSNSI